jgi:hypothetical protein
MLKHSFILTGSISHKSYVFPFSTNSYPAFYLLLGITRKLGNKQMLPWSPVMYPLVCFTPGHHLLKNREEACDPFNDRTLHDFLSELVEERTWPRLNIDDPARLSIHMLTTTPVLTETCIRLKFTYYIVLTHDKNTVCLVVEITDALSRTQHSYVLHEDSLDVTEVRRSGDATTYTFPIAVKRVTAQPCVMCDEISHQTCVLTFRYRPFIEIHRKIFDYGGPDSGIHTGYGQCHGVAIGKSRDAIEDDSILSMIEEDDELTELPTAIKISETRLVLPHRTALTTKALLVRVFLVNSVYSLRQITSHHWHHFTRSLKASMWSAWHYFITGSWLWSGE